MRIYTSLPPVERFKRYVRKLDNGCWQWTGHVAANGYGKFNARKGRVVYAHRWAYEHFCGEVPNRLDLDHLCRNRACCNPDHLEPVTRAENLKRGLGNQYIGRTHCKRGHELAVTGTVTRTRKGGNSVQCCKVCVRSRYARERAAALSSGNLIQ